MQRPVEIPHDISLEFLPLTPETWTDFEKLFGEKGACGGCWCMWWRLNRKDFDARKGEGNRNAMKEIVASGRVPGILAYYEEIPIGWCSVAPREQFIRLQNSKILKPVDHQPVWSIVCLFVAKAYRRRGVSIRLLAAAVKYVGARGGKIVEGYAVEPKKKKIADVFAFHGLAAAYREAGFSEAIRRSETRPIMRYLVQSGRGRDTKAI